MKKMRLNLIVIIALLLCSCAQSPCTPGPERSPSGYEAPSPAVSASPEPSGSFPLMSSIKIGFNPRRKDFQTHWDVPQIPPKWSVSARITLFPSAAGGLMQ